MYKGVKERLLWYVRGRFNGGRVLKADEECLNQGFMLPNICPLPNGISKQSDLA